MRFAFLTLLTACSVSGVLLAQGDPKPASPTPAPAAASPDEARNMMPGAVHAELAKLAGEFATSTKLVVPGEDMPETTGSAKIEPVLEGRFLHIQEQGSMMGAPFSASKMLGYNNGAKMYESVWMYTQSTSMLLLSGESKDGGKMIELKGSYDEGPATGGRQELYVIFKITSPDRFSMEIRDMPADKETQGPVMTTVYTRKK